jgi:hypothetical protein
MLLSACGLKCDECEFFKKTCSGCYNVKGSTFWAQEMMPEKVCPLFDCAVNKKELISCGGCGLLPCELFLKMKDPKSTDEEHKASILKRVELLKAD